MLLSVLYLQAARTALRLLRCTLGMSEQTKMQLVIFSDDPTCKYPSVTATNVSGTDIYWKWFLQQLKPTLSDSFVTPCSKCVGTPPFNFAVKVAIWRAETYHDKGSCRKRKQRRMPPIPEQEEIVFVISTKISKSHVQ